MQGWEEEDISPVCKYTNRLNLSSFAPIGYIASWNKPLFYSIKNGSYTTHFHILVTFFSLKNL